MLKDRDESTGWSRARAAASIIRYLAASLRRRWPPRSDTILLLEMPLTPRPIHPTLVYERIVSADRLSEYASGREQVQDWTRGSYVEEVGQRFRRGDWCFAAMVDGSISSILFASRGPCPIAPVSFSLTLPPGTVAFYDVYTSPEFRRQSVYRLLFNAAVNESIDDGYHQAWLWLMRENTVSLNVHKRLGMEHVILMITHSQRWGLKWHRFRRIDASIDDLSSSTDLHALERTSAS